MLALIMVTCLVASAPSQDAAARQEAPSGTTAVSTDDTHFVDQLSGEIGRFDVTNWVMSGPGDVRELHFVVETEAVLGGAGVRTVWRTAPDGDFFGELTRSLDPQTGEVVQHWYAARSGTWSQARQIVQFDASGHGASFSGEDGYGPFEARTRTMRTDGGGYRWTIERRYPGTDWFLIDRGEAVPASDGR